MTVQVWQSNLTGEKIYTVCEIESPYYTYIGTEDWPDPPDPGTGGTTNYNQLQNRPQIGGVTLSGNKELGQLGELQDFFDEKAVQAVTLTSDTPKLTMTKGSDSIELSADSAKVKNGNDSVTATKDTVEIKNGSDVTTVKKNEIKTTDGTDAMTATPLKVEVKDADETATVAKDSVEVKKGAVITKIEDDRASMTDGTHTIAMSPVKATYGEHLKLDGDGVLESWEKVLGVGNFAVIEKTTVSKAYAVGSYLLSGGTMYRVTKAISSGGAITTTGANANVEAKRVDEVIAELTAKDTAQDTEIAALANSGAKNVFPNTVMGSTVTSNGVTFTVNADGSVTINGKNTATAANQCYIQLGRTTIKKGSYIMSGVPEGYANTMWVWGANVGENRMESERTITLASDITAAFGVTIAVGDTQFDNVTVYPMLRDAAITDDTYVPYAMTNAELTAKKQDVGNYARTTFVGGASINDIGSERIQLIVQDEEKDRAVNIDWTNKRITLHSKLKSAGWGAIDAIISADEDTGWQTLTGTPIKYRKKNGFVSVNIGAMSGAYTYNFTKGQWAQLGTLPTGFRPSGGTNNPEVMTIWIRRASDSTFIPMVCQFASDGIIQVMASETLAASAYNAILGSVSFPV